MAKSAPMVLRSINLPVRMDDQVRATAFLLRKPKSDLIRFFVGRGLNELAERLGPGASPEVLEQIIQDLEAYGESEEAKAGRREDIQRIQDAADRMARQNAAEGDSGSCEASRGGLNTSRSLET